MFVVDILPFKMLRQGRVQNCIVLAFVGVFIIWRLNFKDLTTRTHINENPSGSYNVKCLNTLAVHKTERDGTIRAKNDTYAAKDPCRCLENNYSINSTQEINIRFTSRKDTLEGACSKSRSTFESKNCIMNGVANNLKYAERKEMLYCSIEKTGSTFWKRILHIAGGWRNVSNTTHIRPGEAFTGNAGYRSMKNKHLADIVDTFNHVRSIIFVRNPYTRLFSGWLDKFYSPNTYYWKSVGKRIIKTQRNELSDIKCGYNVTFAEFVNYTVHNVLSSPCIDGHFQSNFLLCSQCNFSFDYIGKYETIKEDTMHLLDVFNLTGKIQFSDFEKDAALDAIRGASAWVFSQRRSVTDECGVPFACALFRVWSRLQSRGVISYNLNFPYKTNQDTSNITKEQFESVLMDAHERSSVHELRNNREAALIQALSTLPKSVVTLVQKAFDLDFELFGYDRIPMVPTVLTKLNTFIFSQNCPPYSI